MLANFSFSKSAGGLQTWWPGWGGIPEQRIRQPSRLPPIMDARRPSSWRGGMGGMEERGWPTGWPTAVSATAAGWNTRT